MRNFKIALLIVVVVSVGACSKRINDKVGLTKDNQGLPQGWVWALGKTFSVALPENTNLVAEQPYPFAQPDTFVNRSDFNASYWDESGKLTIYSVISCDLRNSIDSTQKAISIATELDQGLTDSSPLVMLQEKSVTIDGKPGFEFWRRTQTREENFQAFLDQSPNEEVRKMREEGRPKFDKNPPAEKYHACVVLKDDKKMYVLIVETISGVKITDSIVRPFFDHFKVN